MRITEGPDSLRRLIMITLIGFVVVAVVSIGTGLHAKRDSLENLIGELPLLFAAVVFGAVVIGLRTKSTQRRDKARYEDAMFHGDQRKADIYKAIMDDGKERSK